MAAHYDPPLLTLFMRLRDADLPLGAGEYLLALRALRGGFGLESRAALRELCRTLWAKSEEERRILDVQFELTMTEIDEPFLEPAPLMPAPPEKLPAQPPPVAAPAPIAVPSQTAPLALAMTDEVAGAHVVANVTRADRATGQRRPFSAGTEYFPVTRREMKQAWRYLRRGVREGAPTELDLDATVARIGRDGQLLAPVLRPPRVNRTELVLLIDQDGSMAPFHALSQRLAETAVRGGRLGRANIYYFHNWPGQYLFHSPACQDGVERMAFLGRLHPRRSIALIFSDGGAARGSFNRERLGLTIEFLDQLRAPVQCMAWLNPMPRQRWRGSIAEDIAAYIPMFEMSSLGLDDAIRALRGRLTRIEVSRR